MKNIKWCGLFLMLLTYGINVDGMKRALVEGDNESNIQVVSPTSDLSTTIFSKLPSDVVSRILSYTDLSKQVLICVSRSMYDYFCCTNHLTNDPAARQSWRTLCINHSTWVATNKYDCQRMYYLLMKDNNITGMRQLLKADTQCEENLSAVIQYCFDKPLESIVSEDMKEVVYQGCPSRNRDGKWCPLCNKNPIESVPEGTERPREECLLCLDNIGYLSKPRFPEDLYKLINCIMTNNMDGFEKLNKEMFYSLKSISFDGNPMHNFINRDFERECINRLFHFCSSNNLERLIRFFQPTELDKKFLARVDPADLSEKKIGIESCNSFLQDPFGAAILASLYTKVETFLRCGMDCNHEIQEESGQFRRPLEVAINNVIEKADDTLLNMFMKHGVILNIDWKHDGMYGISFVCDQEIEQKLMNYFRTENITSIVKEYVSPLLYVVLRGSLLLVKRLLAAGASTLGPQSYDEGADDGISQTDLLEIAKALGNKEIIEAISQARANTGLDLANSWLT